MSAIFDALDASNDFAVLVVVMLLTVIAALAWMMHHAQQEIATWQRRAEELACWDDLQIEEINALRKRLEVAERRCANAQAMYVDLVRRRLMQSYSLIERNLERQRRK